MYSQYAVDAALRLLTILRRYRKIPIMMTGTVMHPTMTPASLAPLNIGSVLDCCAESADEVESGEAASLGVDEVPASSGDDVDWPEISEAVSVVFASESG